MRGECWLGYRSRGYPWRHILPILDPTIHLLLSPSLLLSPAAPLLSSASLTPPSGFFLSSGLPSHSPSSYSVLGSLMAAKENEEAMEKGGGGRERRREGSGVCWSWQKTSFALFDRICNLVVTMLSLSSIFLTIIAKSSFLSSPPHWGRRRRKVPLCVNDVSNLF